MFSILRVYPKFRFWKKQVGVEPDVKFNDIRAVLRQKYISLGPTTYSI